MKTFPPTNAKSLFCSQMLVIISCIQYSSAGKIRPNSNVDGILGTNYPKQSEVSKITSIDWPVVSLHTSKDGGPDIPSLSYVYLCHPIIVTRYSTAISQCKHHSLFRTSCAIYYYVHVLVQIWKFDGLLFAFCWE